MKDWSENTSYRMTHHLKVLGTKALLTTPIRLLTPLENSPIVTSAVSSYWIAAWKRLLDTNPNRGLVGHDKEHVNPLSVQTSLVLPLLSRYSIEQPCHLRNLSTSRILPTRCGLHITSKFPFFWINSFNT